MPPRSRLYRAVSALSLITSLTGCMLGGADLGTEAESTSLQAMADAGKPELGAFGIDLSNQDPTVRPGDDFFRFANGRWLENFELPPDRGNYGSFTVLSDRSNDRVRRIIDDLLAADSPLGSNERKITDYFNSWMDTERLDELGASPLQDGLAKLADIDSKDKLVAAFGRVPLDNSASPIYFRVSIDRADPDRHQLAVLVGGIGLPDRDYYLLDSEEFAAIRREYAAHITRVLDFAGIGASTAKAESILALETLVAEQLWPRAQRRDRDLTNNPMDYGEFLAQYPGFDWQAFFSSAGVENLSDVNVLYPSALTPIIGLIDAIPLADWRAYMSYHYISNHAHLLSADIDRENFRFYSTVLRGIPEQRPRWERGVLLIGSVDALGEAIGRIYVERHFPESAKRQMMALIENLRAAIAQSIDEIDWMSAATKAEAHLKLQAFRPKIAYPDKWRDLSGLEMGGSLFNNARNVQAFNFHDEVSRLGKPTDRDEWGMTPQTVNAYYNPSFNEIVFPAGILQPPFFDPAADPAVNYGAIGAVIGHEMGHGFDDQGSKSDFRSVQRNWWSSEDRASFERLTDVLVDQYGQFEPLPGHFVDGSFTLGENIGDVGGLSLAYRAYHVSLQGREAPIIGGLTGDQRFFLAWAQVWQRKYRDDALIRRLKSDPHSPAEFRVNGVVRNFDEWYDAFDVRMGDALYLPPEERVRIW